MCYIFPSNPHLCRFLVPYSALYGYARNHSHGKTNQ